MVEKKRGFTLVELLVVVAIIAILAVIVAIAVNPFETYKKTKDTTRLKDLDTLRTAINLVVASSSTQSADQIFKDSIPHDSKTGGRNCNGTGWVPVDLCKHLPTLPVDPVNDGTTYMYEFKHTSGDYELRTALESQEMRDQRYLTDGGEDSNHYEVGTKLDVL